MPAYRIPGAQGRGADAPCDKGTLSCIRTPDPSPLGVKPLNWDYSPWLKTAHEMFPVAVREALRRGGAGYDLGVLRNKYLMWVRHFTEWMAAESEWSERVVLDEEYSFDLQIQREVKRIPKGLRAYCQRCNDNGKYKNPRDDARTLLKDAYEYRYHIRPLYYAFGYNQGAAEFLQDQVEFSLFKNPKLTTWIHQDLAIRLEELPDVLNKWSDGLADEISKQIKEVGGLECRKIGRSESLSNHAFGLAMDMEAPSNPRAVGFGPIAVFNSVAKEAGVDFDFGKPILNKKTSEYTREDIIEVYNRELPASNAIRSWLKEHLTRYKNLIAEVQAAEKQLGMSPVSSMTTLADRIKGAEAARNRRQFERELNNPNKVSEGRSWNSTSEREPGCEPTYDLSPETKSLEKFNAALGEIASDPDLSRIQVLFENYEPLYINAWEKRGVLTLPVSLAVALVCELQLRWGEQYHKSKDAMHFELMKNRDTEEPYVTPDQPLQNGEYPRTLDRLMNSVFAGARMRPKF
jgi:hypothetical protein